MIYLDNAATTFPKPISVYLAVEDCIKNYCANPGRGSHDLSLKCELKIIECRERIARLLNVKDPMRIIFTSNTTEGLNLAIKGVLKPEDHVITTMIEHNSVLRPLEAMRSLGVEVTMIPVDNEGYISVANITNSVKKNTKAVIINHGSNVLGTVQDISAIGSLCKTLGILFIVDGAQTVGYLDINVEEMNIDILAFPGHKSLLGLQGIGGIYISPNIELKPLKEGGTGSLSNSMIQPTFLPDKFESGTVNTPGIVGLSEGVNFILNTGSNNIRKHESELIKQLTEELRKLPYIKLYGELDSYIKAPVLSFNIDGFDSSEVGELLNEKNFCVRCGYHCCPMIHKIIGTSNTGTVRVSPGYFNSNVDIEQFIIAIENIYKLNF